MARRFRDPKARIEALGQQMEKIPSSTAFFPLASLLWQQGEGPRAEKLLRAGLGIHSAYAAARVLLGEVLLAMDRPQDAAGELAAAVRISPWNLQGQRLLAECLRRAGDEAGARKALGIAAMFDPADPEARTLLEESSRPADSAADRALPAPEGEAPAPVPTPSLAQLYTAQGHHAQAVEVYRQLLRKEPGNSEWRKQLGLLEARLVETPKTAPPTPAGHEIDFDFEEEPAPKAGGKREAKPESPDLLEDDLSALLSEAAQTEAALPALEQEDDDLILENSGRPGAPDAPTPGVHVGKAPLEDDLEAFLGMEDEPAKAASAASGAQETELGEDLEGFFAEEQGAGGPAPSQAASQGLAPRADPGDELDLDALFAAEDEGTLAGAASSAPGPPASAGGRAPDAIPDEELEGLFLEDETEESAPAPPQTPAAASAADESAGDSDFDALFAEEETGAEAGKPSSPLAAASGEGSATDELDDLDLDALFEEEGAPGEGAPAAPRASTAGAEDTPDGELVDLFAEGEEEAAPAAVPVEDDGKEGVLDLDLEVELEEEDLGFPAGMEPGGAEEAEEPAASAAGEQPPAGASREVQKQEPAAGSDEGAKVDPFLRNLIRLYVEEGNLVQALDLCRKASGLGPPSDWLAGQMLAIESRLVSGREGRLQETSKEDNEGEVRFLSPAEVVERLEDWLLTLQRRKARMS